MKEKQMLPPRPRDYSDEHYTIVFGATGLLGSAIARANPDCIQVSSKDFDATSYIDTKNWFRMMSGAIENSTIHIACGLVGGTTQQDYSMFLGNAKMTMNLLECADEFQATGHTINYSSSCIYPQHLDVFSEEDIMSGILDNNKQGYAFGKLLGGKMCEYLNAKRGFKQFTTVVPPNLWGDNDNWDLQTCHVLPALTQRLIKAKREGADTLEIQGSPLTRREFICTDDLVVGALLARDSTPTTVNVGSGTDISIGDCVAGLAERIDYTGEIVYTGANTGTSAKLMQTTLIDFTPAHTYEHMLDYMVSQGATHGIS